jgi:hypothetical protein
VAHEDAGHEETEDDGQADPLADPARRAGDDEDHRQVLDEQDSVHGGAPGKSPRTTARVNPIPRISLVDRCLRRTFDSVGGNATNIQPR